MGQERGQGTPSPCCPINRMWLPQGCFLISYSSWLVPLVQDPPVTPASLGVIISSQLLIPVWIPKLCPHPSKLSLLIEKGF